MSIFSGYCDRETSLLLYGPHCQLTQFLLVKVVLFNPPLLPSSPSSSPPLSTSGSRCYFVFPLCPPLQATRWNLLSGYEKLIMQFKEKVPGAPETGQKVSQAADIPFIDGIHMFANQVMLVTPERTSVLECTEARSEI